MQPTETRVPTHWTFADEQIVRDTLFEVQSGYTVFDVGCGFGSYAFSALAIGATHAHCWSVNAPHIELMEQTAEVACSQFHHGPPG